MLNRPAILTLVRDDQILDQDCKRYRRSRRQPFANGMSQKKLGKALGITFQQVQKYE